MSLPAYDKCLEIPIRCFSILVRIGERSYAEGSIIDLIGAENESILNWLENTY
jgi:hypothetical protein